MSSTPEFQQLGRTVTGIVSEEVVVPLNSWRFELDVMDWVGQGFFPRAGGSIQEGGFSCEDC